MANLEELKRKAQEVAYSATEKAQSAASVASEKAQSAAAVASEKAGVIKDVAKTNVGLVTEKRNLEKCYQALGEWYAAQCGDEAPEGAADMLKAIRDAEAKLEELKARKTEQDTSARELIGKGKGFFAEKASAIASRVKKSAAPAEEAPAEEASAEEAERLPWEDPIEDAPEQAEEDKKDE